MHRPPKRSHSWEQLTIERWRHQSLSLSHSWCRSRRRTATWLDKLGLMFVSRNSFLLSSCLISAKSHLLFCSASHLLMRPFVHSFIYSFIRSFVDPFTHTAHTHTLDRLCHQVIYVYFAYLRNRLRVRRFWFSALRGRVIVLRTVSRMVWADQTVDTL